MHKCMRCGKKLEKIGEIEQGCLCGSKVFLYTKDREEPDGKTLEATINCPKDGENTETFTLSAQKIDKNARALESSISAQMAKARVSGPILLELENIRMLEKGVFNIDLKSLLNDPVVLKDTNGVYFIKLPN